MPLIPTTSIQVSGYRFLQRRYRHALGRGDVRMLHDPERTTSRAITTGVVAAVVAVAGAGLLAVLTPHVPLGEHDFVHIKGSSQTYVRVGDHLHPVTNIASARLMAQAPVVPRRIGEAELSTLQRGREIGLADAPEQLPSPPPTLRGNRSIAAAPALDVAVVCSDARDATATVQLRAGLPEGLGAVSGMTIVTGEGTTWLYSAAGRWDILAFDAPYLRAVGITPALIAAAPPAATAVLEAVPVLPTPHLPEIGPVGEPSSVRIHGHGELRIGQVLEIAGTTGSDSDTTTQRVVVRAHDVLALDGADALVAPVLWPQLSSVVPTVSAVALGEVIIAPPQAHRVTLPAHPVLHTAEYLCVGAHPEAEEQLIIGPAPAVAATAALTHDGAGSGIDFVDIRSPHASLLARVARHREEAGSLWVISDTGKRWRVADEATAQALGFDPAEAVWVPPGVTVGLPAGDVLSLSDAAVTLRSSTEGS